MNKFCLLVSLVLVSCGYLDKEKTEPKEGDGVVDQVEQVRQMRELRFAELRALSDVMSGWPNAQDCDGTLWAGYACAAGADWVDIAQAEYEEGEIHRRPRVVGSCWNSEQGDVGAKATTSNDMIQGYLWCAWRRGDRAAVERLARRGESRAWIMGEPTWRLGEVLLKGNLTGAVGRIIKRWGGSERPYRLLPAVYTAGGEDWVQSLTVMGIALQGEIDEGTVHPPPQAMDAGLGMTAIDSGHAQVLDELAAANPTDWTMQAVRAVYRGDYTQALGVLSDPATPCPTYARGSQVNCLVSWLFAADQVLRRHPKE